MFTWRESVVVIGALKLARLSAVRLSVKEGQPSNVASAYRETISEFDALLTKVQAEHDVLEKARLAAMSKVDVKK